MTLTPVPPEQGTRPAPQLAGFRARCERLAGRSLSDPDALHRFSVERPQEFWRTLLDWSELPWSGSADVVLTGNDVATARFFPDVRLNYAEALLRSLPDVDDDRIALTSVHADRPAEHYSRAALRAEVRRAAAALAAAGLQPGERMVLIAPHTARTIVVALAAAAVGAAISTASPDMGTAALLGRFEQVEPALLVLDRAGTAEDTAPALLAGLPTVRRVVVLDDGPLPAADVPVDRWDARLPDEHSDGPTWERRPFDTPLFVMFSSGTTGPPKAMVHGAGGTLLEHVKELRLHVDLRADDTLYFHTTTAWMMWNWQLTALAVGAHIVVNDAPVTGPESLWRLVAEHGVTVFGTSPAYLQLCQDEGYRPTDEVDLSRLRAVLSTGAVLHDWQYDWVAETVGPVPLQSISGGTDIIGCFVLGSPELPVRRGRIQMKSLGLDVAAIDENGREVLDRVGALVCRRPFPSRPIGFLRDPDGNRFHASYFAEHAGMWTHGDLIEFAPDGSSRLHGRSDGVLNIDGVRVGPSEIYTVLRRLPQIVDAMAVEQRDPQHPGSSRMVLLVVLRAGAVLDADLERTIRRRLRAEASAAHVPSVVLAVPDLPTTHNGKKSERAARDAVNGDPVANAGALKNAGCLDDIRAAVVAAGAGATGPAEPVASSDESVLAEVTDLWCQLLGIGSVGPDDEFSDVGGTSRQVMTLLRRVREQLGAAVPATTFARRPTPRGLAEAVSAARAHSPAVVTDIRQALRSARSDVPNGLPEPSPVPPVSGTADVPLLRPGHGRPVFLLADTGREPNWYAPLVERLATERPVLGPRRALLEPDGVPSSVERTAAELVHRLREVQPEGPYTLIGHGSGGLVAYEVARILRAQGAYLSSVGLVDVPAPDRPGRYDGVVTYYLPARRRSRVGRSLRTWGRAAPHLFVTRVPGRPAATGKPRRGILGHKHVQTLADRLSVTLR